MWCWIQTIQKKISTFVLCFWKFQMNGLICSSFLPLFVFVLIWYPCNSVRNSILDLGLTHQWFLDKRKLFATIKIMKGDTWFWFLLDQYCLYKCSLLVDTAEHLMLQKQSWRINSLCTTSQTTSLICPKIKFKLWAFQLCFHRWSPFIFSFHDAQNRMCV